MGIIMSFPSEAKPRRTSPRSLRRLMAWCHCLGHPKGAKTKPRELRVEIFTKVWRVNKIPSSKRSHGGCWKILSCFSKNSGLQWDSFPQVPRRLSQVASSLTKILTKTGLWFQNSLLSYLAIQEKVCKGVWVKASARVFWRWIRDGPNPAK